MASNGRWRYLAQRFDGTGNLGDFVDLNLPLMGVEVEELLSGHNALSATISPELSRLKGSDGRPVFDEWGVCLWAESPTGEIYGGVLERSGFDGPEWSIECLDLTGALIDTPFDDAVGFENVDPLDVFRFIWQWYQSRPGCNLSLTSDMTASPVRLGTELVQVEDFDPGAAEDPTPLAPSSYTSNVEWVEKGVKKLHNKFGWDKQQIRDTLNAWLNGTKVKTMTEHQQKIVKTAKKLLGKPPNDPEPENATPTVEDPKVYQVDSYKLNWYTNHNLDDDVSKLAAETPFDWSLIHYWSDDGDDADLQHHIRLGWPKLGRRITELRFVLGENIHEVPSVDRDGEEYASEVIVIGNGEGAAAVRGRAYRPTPGRMRRTVVVTDQTLNTEAACNQRAESELAQRNTLEDITELVIMDHPHAPVGSVQLGDEFLLEGETGWLDLSVWVRCVGRRFSPDDGSTMTLSVMRTDRMTSGGQ